MVTHNNPDALDHEFEEVSQVEGAGAQHLGMTDLHDVPLGITVELGNNVMRVREILDLKPGSVIALDKVAGEMTDICVNGLPLAKGEVMVMGDELQVRIGEVIGNVDETAG